MNDKILIDRAVVERALSALEDVQNYMKTSAWFNTQAAALRAALEQQEQEPVLTINKLGPLVECSPTIATFALPDGEFTLYTHPPRREWKGLTDEIIDSVWPSPEGTNSIRAVAYAIEAALKERNT